MMPSTPKTWKLLAWNGIRLCVPPEWEVTSLASSYLLLDDSESPVLELKWRQVKGKFSHEANLRRLARSSSVASKLSLQKKSVLSWQGSEIRGEGAIIYCPTCQTATFFQFYSKSGKIESVVPEQVLHSFRDHCEEGWNTWSLFGMNALVPKGFGVDSHHFHPGHYQLVFRRKSERLEFNRWGPADVLLKQGGLLQWYDERSRGNRHTVTSGLKADEYNGEPALTGQVEGPSSFIRRLWSQIVGKHSYNWIRIWHLRERNQILGVEASDSRKLDESLLEEICRNYEMVSEAETAGV
jgi:hypothetical protein